VSLADSNTHLLFVFFLLTNAKFFAFSSDDEGLKRGAATASLVDTFAANEPPSQEAAAVVKLPEAPVKKGTSSRASKHLKKATAVSTSLDTHRPVGSPDDVSTAYCGLLFFCLNFSSHAFL
jgi:hypothetical protein